MLRPPRVRDALALALVLPLGCAVGIESQPDAPWKQTEPADTTHDQGGVRTTDAAAPVPAPGLMAEPSDAATPALPAEDGAETPPQGEQPAGFMGPESCNGQDDDLDGRVDEALGQVQCGVGACVATVAACVDGRGAVCTPGPPATESCNGIDDNCDGSVDEGLRRPCSSACGSGEESCASGVWSGCSAPAPETERCDLQDNDCDGAVDEDVDGCRTGVHRSLNTGSGEHFYTVSAEEAVCCGFTQEAANYFFIYTNEQPGLIGLRRCVGGNGFHLYTTDPNCEGLALEGTMGYVSPSPVAGARPLYRSAFPSGDHLYTTDQGEHQSAVNNGAADEGITAYVW